jgi:hypothetical protein
MDDVELSDYWRALEIVVFGHCLAAGDFDAKLFRATAPQVAEAIIKAMGLWEE